MKFEWDEDKNRANIKKHGISFEHALLVFDDEDYLEEYDSSHSDEEDRYNVIGMIDEVVFVVCTYRDENTVRLISAREATKDERRRYEWQWLR
ncbi:MAG: BrnT family toxin [Schwartzia sp.]|nr:BrnT family toxin [Schwartzia sp. (in: firmicutes)]